jgi:DNA-binding NarL/FixJ family response regulator
MLSNNIKNDSLNKSAYVFIEINDDAKNGLDAVLNSGVADSYNGAILKLFGFWSLHFKFDDFLNNRNVKHPKLSKRQKQLIPLLNMGKSNREIANDLNLSEHTIKVHMWRFFKKMNVNSRAQLLYVARLNGWA